MCPCDATIVFAPPDFEKLRVCLFVYTVTCSPPSVLDMCPYFTQIKVPHQLNLLGKHNLCNAKLANPTVTVVHAGARREIPAVGYYCNNGDGVAVRFCTGDFHSGVLLE